MGNPNKPTAFGPLRSSSSVQISGIEMPSTLRFGKVLVTTAGTEVPLSGSPVTLYNGVTVRALSTNTQKIYIGSNPVSSTDGFQLSAGQEAVIIIDNLNKVYIDADVSGEGITFIGS
jgi:hypothetical protein